MSIHAVLTWHKISFVLSAVHSTMAAILYMLRIPYIHSLAKLWCYNVHIVFNANKDNGNPNKMPTRAKTWNSDFHAVRKSKTTRARTFIDLPLLIGKNVFFFRHRKCGRYWMIATRTHADDYRKCELTLI